MTKWYALVIGVILALVGLDPWLPTGPEVMVMPTAGVVSIVLGIVGIVLALKEMKGDKKRKEPVIQPAPTPPATPPASPNA